jgi:hypothetical protein
MSDATNQPSGGPDQAALLARFEAEVAVAGIAVTDEDRGPLLAMWTELQPIRDRLRNADLALEEEPSFTQKPAQSGAGITLPGIPKGGPA